MGEGARGVNICGSVTSSMIASISLVALPKSNKSSMCVLDVGVLTKLVVVMISAFVD